MPKRLKEPAWFRYQVGTPSSQSNWTNLDCQPLTRVTHVAHAEAAISIIRDGKIKAGLVFDKSRLNTERIQVVWTSPNDWNPGSRYGNIEFSFDFSELVKDKRYYWVEDMQIYRPTACRILITDNDYDDLLEPYDPEDQTGPWYYEPKGDIHYWNGTYCLEFMFEQDVLLKDCCKIDYTDHHRSYCCINAATCKDIKKPKEAAAAIFIAGIIAQDLDIVATQFTSRSASGKQMINPLLEAALVRISGIAEKADYAKGRIDQDDDRAEPIVRAFLFYLSLRDRARALSMASIIKSVDVLKQVLYKLAVEKFKIDSLKRLIHLLDEV